MNEEPSSCLYNEDNKCVMRIRKIGGVKRKRCENANLYTEKLWHGKLKRGAAPYAQQKARILKEDIPVYACRLAKTRRANTIVAPITLGVDRQAWGNFLRNNLINGINDINQCIAPGNAVSYGKALIDRIYRAVHKRVSFRHVARVQDDITNAKLYTILIEIDRIVFRNELRRFFRQNGQPLNIVVNRDPYGERTLGHSSYTDPGFLVTIVAQNWRNYLYHPDTLLTWNGLKIGKNPDKALICTVCHELVHCIIRFIYGRWDPLQDTNRDENNIGHAETFKEFARCLFGQTSYTVGGIVRDDIIDLTAE